MERYINISLDLKPIISKQLDFRIPSSMKLKEILQIISDSYQLEISFDNPSMRIVQTGKILLSTSTFESLKDGMLIKLETI
ncbi:MULTISPECIES: type VII secretion protein [Parvimonas]|jgi:yukD|uniref:type VII secretion protein n=1 Tax=Parvimonas TaxID=543311 RepID=UPI0020039C31|nr:MULTISPECIES: type VII secretion protein [Parvimonas]MCK6130453.1 type VII secretion protein [Parvimonas micra]MCK6136100.1 type VII secretion protein [Parvimonas micra]MCK6137571.1 type VII secretion protein [Parvimonas micra]MCK6154099.1 type VII secretion protein [Parvimonas micra]MEB3025550.1 type VII secretion protein [Parvimonas sp. M13]